MKIHLDFTYDTITPASQRAEWQSWCDEFVATWFHGNKLPLLTYTISTIWHPSIAHETIKLDHAIFEDEIYLYVGRRPIAPARAYCAPAAEHFRVGSLSIDDRLQVFAKQHLLHELGHLLGIGTSKTWEAMHPGTQHIPQAGHLFSAGIPETQQFTELDHRALTDLGWKLRPWLFDRDGWVWASDGSIAIQPFGTGYGGKCNPKWRPDGTLTCWRSHSANTVQVNCYRGDGSYAWHDTFTAV